MFKKLLVFGTLLAGPLQCLAQQEAQEKDSLVYRTVLIVTFNPQYYLSDTDRDIINASKVSFKELLTLYRNELGTNLKARLSRQYNAVYLGHKTALDSVNDYSLVYNSISYSYEPLPETKEKAKASAIKGLFSRNSEDNAPVAENQGIKDGQLYHAADNTPKYMAVNVTSPKLMPYLVSRYNPDYILFINQFEAKMDMGNYSVNTGELKRVLKVHFTFIDRDGNRVCSNLVQEPLEEGMNNVHDIIKNKFPSLADKIVACLPEGIIQKIKLNSK